MEKMNNKMFIIAFIYDQRRNLSSSWLLTKFKFSQLLSACIFFPRFGQKWYNATDRAPIQTSSFCMTRPFRLSLRNFVLYFENFSSFIWLFSLRLYLCITFIRFHASPLLETIFFILDITIAFFILVSVCMDVVVVFAAVVVKNCLLQ